MVTADRLAFLHATLDAAQAEARAASTETGSAFWRGTTDGLYSDDASNHPGPFLADSYGYNPPEIVTHIARHDPAAVLRRIAADRKQLELHAAVPGHGRFSERGCDASCDGAHEMPPVCRACRNYAGDPVEAPCATVEILAEGWGWTQEAT